MNTVELLEESLKIAEQIGCAIRYDFNGEEGGAFCELRGQRIIFLDPEASPAEQLRVVASALREIRGEGASKNADNR